MQETREIARKCFPNNNALSLNNRNGFIRNIDKNYGFLREFLNGDDKPGVLQTEMIKNIVIKRLSNSKLSEEQIDKLFKMAEIEANVAAES